MGFQAQHPIPVLRSFDERRAREFYVEYLGFTVDWEHRFEGVDPLYLQVSRGNIVLHLSEHHGDGTPGSVVYIGATGVEDLHRELAAKDYGYLKPGLHVSHGMVSISLLDPFGNELRIEDRSNSQ
nr:glyoxalase superfamily protein [Rhodococcus sp. (in: high G+C Gram-positive bacteria)]